MRTNYLHQETPLTSLRHRWWIVAFFFTLTLWSGYELLRTNWHPTYAWRWIIVAALVLAYELWLLWRGLKHNHRQGETALLPAFGLGNALTLWRGLGIALLAGFLFSPWSSGGLAWAPALLYTLAAIADGLDGYLARLAHQVTRLGEILDMEFDALGLLVATFLAVQYKQLPWWYLFLGLARYLFILGIWWRTRQGKPVYDLPPSATRRMIAGFQMGFSTVMLWPIVYPPGTILAGIVFAIPFVASFSRDWLVVSGRIDPTSPQYLAIRHKFAIIVTRWLSVPLRALVVMAVASLIIPASGSIADQATLFIWPGLPFPNVTALIISGMAVVTTAMLALGIAGRLAAFGLIIAASTNILGTGLYLPNGLVLSVAITLMLLGSGALSIWQPEDAILSRRPGEERSA
jgi:CDP-diacylglycerol--glycerol-3-phosphate 3-phosphatidyltransferase